MRRRWRHKPVEIVRNFCDGDAMLSAGKDQTAVLQALEVTEATLFHWRQQSGGMKAEVAKRLKELEEENKRLKEIVAEQALDINSPWIYSWNWAGGYWSSGVKIRWRHRAGSGGPDHVFGAAASGAADGTVHRR